uniref:Uncharacterized protein n=1 Tax=Helianthus annuus TaxID=4232 RepID=A0A251U811_HELAN
MYMVPFCIVYFDITRKICTYVVVYVCMCKDMYECMHVCKVVRKVCMYVEEYVCMQDGTCA